MWVWKRFGVNEIHVARVSCIFTAFLFQSAHTNMYIVYVRNSIVKHRLLYIFVTCHALVNCSVTEYKQNKICAKFILQVNKRTRLVTSISKLFQMSLTVKYSSKKHKIGSWNQGEEQIIAVPGNIR